MLQSAARSNFHSMTCESPVQWDRQQEPGIVTGILTRKMHMYTSCEVLDC